jgi:cytochrome c
VVTFNRKVREKKLREEGMNRSVLAFALASSALLMDVTFGAAQQSGTAAEAKAMFDRAVQALKTNETTALAAFNDKNNKDYHDRDLYVFCYNMKDGVFTAHVNSAMMGKDVRTIKVGDDPLGQRLFDVITKAPEGAVSTVEYKFPRPGTTEPVPKESYVTRIANEGCGVGYYK